MNRKNCFHILLFCTFIFILFAFGKRIHAQQVYNHVFNPIGGFVNDLEKPYRSELNLNGKWQFMPVYETNRNKFVKPEAFLWDAVPLKVPSPWNVNSFSKGDGGDFLVRLGRTTENRDWSTRIRFESNNPDFLKQLNSSVGQ